jgi:peptide-methionine (S)-S-oxide reductase
MHPLAGRVAALFVLVLAAVACSACGGAEPAPAPPAATTPANATPAVAAAHEPAKEVPAMSPTPASSSSDAAKARTETATLAGGCFWCVEAVLETVPGVLDVRSGYMGGATAKPTYREVCNGDTGHAEVVQVTFDPAKLAYEDLLAWFWKAHDPTTMNRQGADAGTQYRSAIFFHSEAQRAAAEKSKAAAQKDFADPIVTEITAAGAFTEAEDYHQDYFRLNGSQPYCRAVIAPKLKKLGIETK